MAEIEELDSELLPLGSSPLHVIANSGDIKSLKLLLESSACKSQIDLLDHHGRTPLAVALQNGRFDAARVLIESGANFQLGFDNIPVSEVTLATLPYQPFLETLIEADLFISFSPSLLALLAYSAAYDGRGTFLLKLLGSYEFDVDSKDNLGQTALHYASRRNNLDCVETLLRYGANVMVTNPQRSTALHMACIGGHLGVVPLLLQDWVVPDAAQLLNLQDSQGRTPLQCALYYKKLEVCEYIMSNYSSSLNLALFDNTGYTTPTLLFMLKTCSRFAAEFKTITCILSTEEASWLLFEGVAQDNLELVNHSIASGAIIESVDHMQQTPLLLATKFGHFEVFRALLVAGADPNATDQGRKTPLHYAYELGRLDFASHLLSLEHLDLTLFFDGYDGPLTTELLVPLIDHMSNCPSRRPKNWRKWLTLVARNVNIPISVFGQLVSVICPYDWVEHLPSQQGSSDSSDITHVSQPVQQMLPILADGKNKDKHSTQVYQKLRSQRMPLKERRQIAKEIGGVFSCMRQRIAPKIFTSGTPKRSVCPGDKTTTNKPFQFHFKKNSVTTSCPVHEAARHGNTNVLEYLLSNARESSQSLLKQLVTETRDSCGLTVAELLAQHYPTCREVIIKLDISELVMSAVSDIWPLQFNYTESLLHYIVSGGSSHSVGQKQSKTPLDKWPQWVFEYIMCYHEDVGELELDEDGEKSNLLLQTLIKTVETLTITEEKGYPPLLFAAVKSGNELAVRLLLENGAAPTAKFRGRYAITEAAISCNTTIIDHFLLVDGTTFLSTIPDFKEFTDDLHLGLCSLANSGFVEAVERVITHLGIFPDSAYLWQSSRSLRLLYLLVESNSRDSLELSDALAFDLTSFLIKSKLPQGDTEDNQLYDADHATRLMQIMELYFHSFCKCDSSNVRLLQKLAKFYNRLYVVSSCHQYAFHYLCGLGEFELVSHFLNCLDSSHHAELFRYMNDHQQSPLYYAASGGHLDIVELLLDKGCEQYYSNENPPIKAALVYLVCSVPYYYSHHIKFNLSQIRYRKQLSNNDGSSPDFVHRSASTCSSTVSMVELINSLLPSAAEDLQEVFSNEVYASDIISLIAFQRNLHAVHPLLLLFSSYLEQANTGSLSISSDSLEEAVNLVQCCASLNNSESFDLLDIILAKLATFTIPHLSAVVTATKKGLWKLVRQALKSPLELPNDSLTTQNLSHVVLAAAREGKYDIVALVHSIYLYEREILYKCYSPLLQAFEHGQLELSCFIGPQHGSGFLEKAVKLGTASVLEAVLSFLFSTNLNDFDRLIRHCCSTECLAVLHKYFMESLVPSEQKFEDRNQEFWFKVLLLQSSKGNTELALEAISSLSDTQLRSFSRQSKSKIILGNCCYWGMKDILECLPFEITQLLEPCSPSEPLSPWEIATAMGHIGKLSEVDNFPSCSKALESISCNSPLRICFWKGYSSDEKKTPNNIVCIAPYFFQGVFHKLLSSPVDGKVSTTESEGFLDFREESSQLDLFKSATRLGKFHFVKMCLEHFGGYAGELLDVLSKEFIHCCCERKDNVEILELFLSHLHNADRLNKYLDVSDQRSLLSMVVGLGSVSCTKILVRWLSSDTLNNQLHCQYQLSDKCGSNNTCTLLHLAVLSKCTEMVDCVLELLGRDAPRSCYAVNSNGHSPLSLAFALGLTHMICYSELITEASKYSAESDQHDSSIWKKNSLFTKCGWFPLLMQLHTRTISASNANVESTETQQNLSFIAARVPDFRHFCIGRLFRDAAKGRKDKVVSRLLFLVEKFDIVPNIILDPEVLNLLVAGGYLSGVSFTLPQKSLQKVITSCGREDLLVNLLKLDFILHAGLMKQAFLYACELNKSTVIHYFLQERDTHLLFEDSSVLKEGLAHAIACGSHETASLILLEGGVHLEDKYLPPGSKLSEVVELIYTCTSYHQLLKKFFSSLTETNHDRIPISVAWLAHGWTEKEAKFIMNHLGGSNPSNPWVIHLQSQMDPHEISLSIDWESFSECLLHSPQVENVTSKFRHTPLLVEAIVFSPSVLGQICQTCSTTQCFDIFMFPKAANLSSLILSSVLWPQEPSFSSLFEGQGILTLSFMPAEGVFLFPSPTSTLSSGLDDSTMSCISDVGVNSSIVDSCFLVDQLNDLAHFSVISLKKETQIPKSIQISISFSDNIMDITDVNLITLTYACIQMILSDIVGVFKLVQKSNRVASSFCVHQNSSGMKVFCSSHFKFPFNEVKIFFDLSDHYLCFSETDVINASVTGYTLNVQFVLPRESNHDLSSYNVLPEVLISHIVGAQVQYAKRKLEKSISTMIVTNLKNHLRISSFLESDFISLLYEDTTGQKVKLDNVESISTSLYVKLGKFLLQFSKLFHVLTYQPRLQASVRRLFETGFKVILSDKLGTSFVLKMSMPCIMVNVCQILEGMPREVLVEVFRSLINSVQGHKRYTLDGSIPLPIMCYIDFENSSGLLYPILNKTGVITVQLANHNSEIISCLPTVSCVLNVCIITPDGSKITATSSQDPSPQAASRQLMANAKPNGQFIIEWTPTNPGLHCISIVINDCHVKGSPFKTHTLSSEETCHRQASAGELITFVVSHNLSYSLSSRKHGCSGSVPPIVLYKRRNFREVIAEGDVSTPLSSPSKTSPSKLNQSLSAKGCNAVHHISMCSRYGGSRKWFHVPVGDVVIYISPHASVQRQSSRAKVKRGPSRSSFTVKYYPMNDGFTRLVISCRYAAVYKMFVACSKCQSVMDVLWLDQRSSLPSLLYVTPTSFSGHYSELMSIKSGATSTAKRPKVLLTATAGDRVRFSLKAYDSFSNPHTTGSAIHKASLKGAGQRDVSFLANIMFGERLQGALNQSRGVDMICCISDEGNGIYIIDGRVFTAGIHDIVVTNIDHVSFTMGQIIVVHTSPYAKYCCLDLDSVYHTEPEVSKTYTILMKMYDEFFNACNSSRVSLAEIQASVGQEQLYRVPYNKDRTKLKFSFTPYSPGQVKLIVSVRGELLRECPLTLTVKVVTESFLKRFKALRQYLREYLCYYYTPTLTIDRNNLLECAMSMLNVENYFKRIVRVRFGNEPGIDTGGLSREFFHLLILECLNPQYALFQCVNGLYKPNPNSYINNNHLLYFKFVGKVLARCICDSHLSPVRFTPSVYKSLLQLQCSLEDLKIEDPILYMGLVNIMNSESEEELELLALSFTASQSHFGSVKTVELAHGGKNKSVTLANRREFVHKLYSWHLTGCIQEQLECLFKGFTSIIPAFRISNFSPHELEIILCGQSKVNVSFIKRRTVLVGYSRDSNVVKWLWEILESYSQETLCQFLQFTTGSTSLPSSDTGEWEFRIQQGSRDPSALPQVATCFNTITLPHYPSKKILKEKLHTALEYGNLSFGRH